MKNCTALYGGDFCIVKKNTKQAILNELTAIAFSDFTKFVSLETIPDKGQVMTVSDTAVIGKNDRRAVCSIRAGTKGVEVKLYDKIKALELLGRTCGVFGDKQNSERDAVDQLRSLFEESDKFDTDG